MKNSILSIEDLRTASEADVAAARRALSLKGRLYARLKEMGRRTGLTRAEYMAIMADKQEHDCSHCNGSGKRPVERPREVGVIHPSSSNKCVLRLYYDVTGELAPQESIKYELQVTFAIGHAVHAVVQNALAAELGENFHAEKKCDLNGLVRGNTDGDIWLPDAHAVLEIKTMGSEYAGLSKPKEDHLVQAMGMYATALDAPFVVYLYISKEWPYDMKEFVEVYDPKIFERWARYKGAKVQRALETGDPPIADAEPAECGECPYAYKCPQKLEKKGGKAFARANGKGGSR